MSRCIEAPSVRGSRVNTGACVSLGPWRVPVTQLMASHRRLPGEASLQVVWRPALGAASARSHLED